MTKAEIWYFKQSGKWYASGYMECDPEEHMYQLAERLEEMIENGIRPGLCNGRNEFVVMLTGKDELGDDLKHGYPAIVTFGHRNGRH